MPIYDNWERLVGAVLRREQLRFLSTLSTSSEFSLSTSSNGEENVRIGGDAPKNMKNDVASLPASSLSSPSLEEPSTEILTGSSDLSLLADGTSFIFEGHEGDLELETTYKELGVSVAYELGIPPAEREAMTVCSFFDCVSPFEIFRVNVTDVVVTDNIEPQNQIVSCQKSESDNLGSDFATGCGGTESSIRAVVGEVCELSCSAGDRCLSSNNSSLGEHNKVVKLSDRIGGIKGVRPPALAAQPAMSFARWSDKTYPCSNMFGGFSREEDGRSEFRRPEGFTLREAEGDQEFVSDREVEAEEEDINDMGRRISGSCMLSRSYSFTSTSNDDDSSSTTTDTVSTISPNGRFRRNITYWQKGELLGRGSFGSVYEGISDGGFFFAVKEVSLLDQGSDGRQSVYQLEQEIALLSQFEHENIVEYYGTDKDASKLYIFLELVTKGSLLSLYQRYHLQDSQVSAYTRQILHGLKYLHDRNVVHRDIKCANILVDASGSVKLADFGLAKAMKLNDARSCKGTAFWMAPEIVRSQQGYGLAADIWSLGCTVLEMLTQKFPYFNLNYMQAAFKIGLGELPDVPRTLSRNSRDFIFKCLQVDPSARPSAAQLLEHPFVRRPLPSPTGLASPMRRETFKE